MGMTHAMVHNRVSSTTWPRTETKRFGLSSASRRCLTSHWTSAASSSLKAFSSAAPRWASSCREFLHEESEDEEALAEEEAYYDDDYNPSKPVRIAPPGMAIYETRL